MRLTVDPAEAGTRLDALLAEPLGSRSRAARLIDAGAVLVDGRTEPKRYAVQAGQTIEVDDPDDAPAPVDVGATVE
ncbi:MAG TPA: S4 domain-containing protein, partial [Baekduia sp.]|nr:S4 domain-containing protein [Baekduia sp.]